MDAHTWADKFIDADYRHGLLLCAKDVKARADSCVSRQCGNCEHWMKSKECPRERNINGMSRGPSMNDAACTEFVLSPPSQRNFEKLMVEVNELLERANMVSASTKKEKSNA